MPLPDNMLINPLLTPNQWLPRQNDLPSSLYQPYVPQDSLGNFARTLQEISQAQMKRRQDEQMLRTQKLQEDAAQLRLEEERRRIQNESAVTPTLQGAFAPEPIGPYSPAMTPDDEDAYDLNQYEGAIQKLYALGTPEARKVAMDLETKVVAKKQDRALRMGQLGVQKERLKQNLLLGFAKKPAGLKLVQPSILADAGLDAQAVANIPEDAEGEIQYFDDPKMGRRPYVRTKQGGIHWLDAFTASANLASLNAGLRAPVTVSGEQGTFRIPPNVTGQVMADGSIRPSTTLPSTLPAGKITGAQPTAPSTDTPPGPPPVLSPANLESLAMGDIVQPSGDSTGPEPLRPRGGGGNDLALRKFELAQAREERLRAKQENEQWVREGKALDKSPAVVQYRNMAQPMSNIAVAESMISEAGGSPAEMDLPEGDPAILRQVDNLLVRTAASLFEPKVGVVREGEVASLVGGTNMKQAIYRFMESANWDERNVVEVMPPAMRRAIISAARKTQELRQKDFEYVKSLASEGARNSLKFDVTLPSQKVSGGTGISGSPASGTAQVGGSRYGTTFRPRISDL